jgi:hypothetical protein
MFIFSQSGHTGVAVSDEEVCKIGTCDEQKKLQWHPDRRGLFALGFPVVSVGKPFLLRH